MKLLSDLERDICVKSEKARVNVFLFCFLMRNCSLSIFQKIEMRRQEGEMQKKKEQHNTNFQKSSSQHTRAKKKQKKRARVNYHRLDAKEKTRTRET